MGERLLLGQRGRGGVRALVRALQCCGTPAHIEREVAERDLADRGERVLREERLVALCEREERSSVRNVSKISTNGTRR